MDEYLNRLEAATLRLEEIRTLMCFLAEYFDKSNPAPLLLAFQYNSYSALCNVILRMSCEQSNVTNEIYNGLSDAWRTLKAGVMK